MTRWDVINGHLEKFKEPTRFLEIGTKYGYGGIRAHATHKVGVDPNPCGGTAFYDYISPLTSDAFFSDLGPMHEFHVVLIDGLHHADQVLRDVENSLKHLHPEGLIVVHDCNPQSEEAQRVPRPVGKNRWNGDVWKAIVTLRVSRPDLLVNTLDADEGLGIIRRATHENFDTFEVPNGLTWEGLVQNRGQWLGLMGVDPIDVTETTECR